MMDQSVKNSTGDHVIKENPIPFAEFKIGGYDHAPFLITVCNQLEEQLRAFSVKRYVSPLVTYEKVKLVELLEQSVELAFFFGLDEFVHESYSPEESYLLLL